jgi:ankyrin repeat protein
MSSDEDGGFQDQDARELLHFAAQSGDLKEVNALLTKGYDPNAFDDIGHTPLHYAAKAGHAAVVERLVSAGANVNSHDESQIGDTPLGHISGNCSYEMAELLIRLGADPTIRGWMQISALDRASERKKPEGRRVYQLLTDAAKKRLRRERGCH